VPTTGLAAIPPPPFQELTLGPLNLRLYGLCIALGVLAAVWIGQRRWRRAGGDPEDITTIALAAVPAGLVGARLWHVATDWSDKYSDGRWWPDAFMVWKGGLGIPGGILLGTVVGALVARRLRIDWRRAADALAPALPVAQAIGRLGNYFNQELFGRPTDLPWGLEVELPFRPVRYQAVETFHPTFLYEGLWNLSLAGLIVAGSRRTVLRPGRWFAVYVLGYGVGRLWVEALRIDEATQLLGLRVNIWTALVLVAIGGFWLFWGGNPLDREATERLRAGEPLADVLAMPPSTSQLAAMAIAEGRDPAEAAAERSATAPEDLATAPALDHGNSEPGPRQDASDAPSSDEVESSEPGSRQDASDAPSSDEVDGDEVAAEEDEGAQPEER
jgi:prolipoprotein diacylglyceryl transferase